MIAVKSEQIPSKRTVLLYPDEDGYVIAKVRSLPGCIT